MAIDSDDTGKAKRIRVSKDESSKLQGDVVSIVVGPKKELYRVHPGLARTSSPFIDKALTGTWKEQANHTIQLPNEEPEIFGTYVQWLYFGTLPVIGGGAEPEFLQLVKAYVLGNKLLDTGFQNALIDAIIERRRAKNADGRCSAPTMATINHAYLNTTPSAPIRQLLVDISANRTTSPKWLKHPETDLPQAFLLDLVAKLLDRRAVKQLPLQASDYHVNETDA
ncbi:BTB/POZ domain-containing protein [Aspergillus homomorphus CBS 101889]|uniref:BTB domain-containing protein n=1 Tax=Aspergillus homomorphus (strain CBS 101889) TaxID=1450537 RepID=A0A395HXR4_ASPHC|nr:hypothetical protein BO97DRAFT_477659 [Aspergillus homomorphus CBS 101889]RAL12597.1 hypothetical protein BO97DRAFT_477659 [Aspergillus homomorphus CBS 101889]